MESHKRGDATEAVVLAVLKKREIPVAIPFGDNERYDFVIQTPDSRFLRAQVKTGWTANGVVNFRGYSQHTNSKGNVYKKYEGDVDCFLVYSHERDSLFFVWENELNLAMSIRVEQAEQNHESINWAAEFDFDERWPPRVSGLDRRVVGRSPAVSALGRALEKRDIPFTRISGESYDFVAVDPEGRRHTICARAGTVVNGRLRFDGDGESEIDAYGVFSSETDTIYLVPDDTFDRSISLRVDEPRQADASINWAEDYEFEARWPP